MPRRNTRKVSHLLAADLRRQVLTGELQTGQQLPSEAALVEAFRVSRDSLREALRILESQSLVEVRRGRGGGTVVRRPGLEAVGRYVAMLLQLRGTTLEHVEEARVVIEPPTVEQLASTVSDDGLDALIALHDDERRAKEHPLRFATAVTAFDQRVTEVAGNRSVGVIAGVFRDLHAGQVFAAMAKEQSAAVGVVDRVVELHQSVLHALRDRDGSQARRAWAEYLSTASTMLVSRRRSRQPIDMAPLWRAQGEQLGGDRFRRMATVVASEIRARIAEDQLREGDRLPSLTDLATEFGISRPTLREALRILEMELLLELRTGDRGGAVIRLPSTQVAAQLAGIVLEARKTTMGDFYRARRIIEPGIMELAASRIGPRALKRLAASVSQLAELIEDTPAFVKLWVEAEFLAFWSTGNPALTVIAEILHWVHAGAETALTAGATKLPWVAKTNRRAQLLFSEFVSAAADGQAMQAREMWARFLEVSGPFYESPELGERLIIDLMDW